MGTYKIIKQSLRSSLILYYITMINFNNEMDEVYKLLKVLQI